MTHAPTAFASLLLTLLSLFLPAAAAPEAAGTLRPKPTTAPVSGEEASHALYLAAFEQYTLKTYVQAGLTASGLSPIVFREALIGFYSLQQQGLVGADKNLLTIIDFSRPSREKRLWVVDLTEQRLRFHTLVAHGKNTGADMAQTFSNREGSEMSSLGFYRTAQPYMGKHGLSLKLQGLDAGYNTNAASRAVVVHGADYVSETFVRQHGRLGRSQGCPALPVNECSAIVRAIKGGSVVYAHGPGNVQYDSDFLKLNPALTAFARAQGLASR